MCWRSLFCCFTGDSEEKKPLNSDTKIHYYAFPPLDDFYPATASFPSSNSGSPVPPPTPHPTPMGEHQDFEIR